jgi:ribosome maturation factor RimP
MEPIGRVEKIVTPTLEAMGYDLVRVHHSGGKRPVLQIMVEPSEERAMTLDDCAEVSRALSAVLDVEDPIKSTYILEVSSPGIDRPLVRPRDFDRFAGFEARVETHNPVEGRKRFRGRLGGLMTGAAPDGRDAVSIATDDGETLIPFAEIAKAKLVLTDELLAAARQND